MPSEDEEDLAAFLDAIQPVQAPTPVAVTPATTAAEESDDALEDLLPSIQEPARPRTAAVVEDDEDGDDISDFVSSVGITSERDVPDITKPWMKYHKFVRVTTVEELDRIVDEALAHGRCALDLETEGLDNRIVFTEAGPKTVHQIVGFCLSMDGLTGYYAPVRHKATDGGPDLNVPVAGAEAAIRRLCLASQPVGVEEAVAKDPLSFKDFVSAPKVILYFFNAQFDQEFLYPVTGIDWWHPDSFEDGILAGFARHAADKALGLKHKAQEFLRDKDGNRYVMIELKELFIRGRPVKFDHLSPDEPGVIKYACSDAICTYLLCEHPDLMKLVKDKYLFTYRLEKQVSQVVRVMERNRVRIDRDTVREILRVNETERNRILGEIRSFAEQKGFHNLEPSSTKQLGEFLFGDGQGCMNITPKPERNEKSGQYKTDAETLENMVADNPHAPPVLKWVVEYRQVEKIIGTYLLSLANNPDANSELRFSFKQTGAGTGRFSAPANADKIDHGFSGVPVHGIPGESTMRKVFIAREGYTYAKCDYAGQELRIASNVSGEPVWVKEFLEGSGDLHSITARAFFNKQEVTKDERSKGKCVHPDTLIFHNHGLIPVGDLSFPEQEDTFLEKDFGLTFDGHTWRPLKATFNGGTKPLYHVVLSGGLVTCTGEHSFKTSDGRFIRTEDLKAGMSLEKIDLPQLEDHAYPELKLSLWEGIPESSYRLNHHFAYFAGVFAGDGTGNDSSAAISHGASEKLNAFGDPYEDWIRSLEESCVLCGFTSSRKDSGQLYLGSRVFVRFLRALGVQRKHQKRLRIPSWVLSTGKQAVLHYLGGLFDTDGTVGADSHNLDWTTKDFVFAGQIATAMRVCGLDFNVELTFNRTYERYYVRLRLTVESSWQMRHFMKHRGKLSRLREPIYDGKKKSRFEVVEILPTHDGPCVDITVGDSHVYLANGFVTHNTANFALIYGGGPQAIIRATGCDKLEASRRKQSFDKAVPTFAKWIKSQHISVKRDLGVWTSFGRWLAIPDANINTGIPEKDKAVRAACERYSTNYPIQGSGADIMKISMVLLHKEFHKRGWLRNGGDDSVRMLMTVHDELVFEIRHARVVEAIPLIVKVMESPTLMAKPRWQVPLIVEPLIGPNWGSGYKCERVKPGHKAGEGEVIVNGYLYGTIRKAEKGDLVGLGEVEEGEGDKRKLRIVDPPWLRGVVPDNPEATSTPVVAEAKATSTVPASPSPTSAPATVAKPPSTPPQKSNGSIVTLKICRLNRQTVDQVFMAVWKTKDSAGKSLRLTDGNGAVLVDPSLGVKVDPDKLSSELFELNLGDGSYGED